ncbi:MAG: M48 family metalloprotease [Deltaproteobacteria bacterium]|nr:M48 family metalloprotease [Candidatus Zymogenaceae bacterium]
MKHIFTRISVVPISLMITVLLIAASGVRIAAGQDFGFDFDDFNLVSVEEEIEIGKELSREIEKEYQLYPDSEVQRYARELGARIAPHAPNTDNIPLSVKVIKDDEVNAFTIPGGYIYVNSGLIRRVDTEAELAGVIAHEMGHAVKRHGTEQLTTIMGINLVMGLLLGSDAPDWQYLVGDLFSSVGLLAYGRDNELQADRLAVRISHAAGYDAAQYLTFMYKLQEMEDSEPSALTELFSTHPSTSERISTVKAEISQLDSKNTRPIVNTRSFDTMKRRIR